MGLARYQPRSLQVDQAQPLAAGLRLALLPGVGRSFDPASMRTVTPNGMKQVPAPTGYAAGFGATLGAATSDKVLTHVAGALPTARSYFFRARRNGPGGGNLGRLFDKSSGSSGQFLYFHNASGFLRYGIHIASSETNTDIVSGADIAVGQWFDVLVTHLQVGSTATLNAYINGNQVVANRIINGTLTDAAGTAICIGNRNSDNARVWDGLIAAAYVWDKDLTQADATALSANPYTLFAAPEEDEFFPQAAASASITVSPASQLLSGGDVAMRVSRRSAVQPAQLLLAGSDVALRASRKVDVLPAALVVNGGQVDQRAARRVAVAPVQATLVGRAVEFVYAPAENGVSYSFPVAPAALGLMGGNVGIRVSRGLRIVATSYALHANEVVFTDSRTSRPIEAAKVPASRTVVFGGGRRIVNFNGGVRLVQFSGGIRIVRF